MSQLYTTSRLRVFRECNRKHLYRYVLRISTPSTPAMAFGTNAHAALEAWYLAWQAGADRLPAAFAIIDALDDASEVDRIRLRALVAAYDARWGGEDWEIIGVEVEFRYFLGDVEIGGKIDALIRDRRDGRVYIVEHKTSTADTSPGAPYWDRLVIDTQISIYIDGATMLGHEIAGCIYDVLKRPQHEPLAATPPEKREYTLGVGCKKCGGSGKAGEIVQGRGRYLVKFPGEPDREISCEGCAGTGWKLDEKGTPKAPKLYAKQRAEDETLDAFEERLTDEIVANVDDYLSRGVIVRLTGDLPKMRQELLDTIASMRALDDAGLAAPNHDACVRGRDFCPYFDACAGRQDIHDQHVYPRGEAHPELASAA